MSFVALLSSFALMASGPSTVRLAQADAPVATHEVDPALQANANAKPGEAPFPAGAPTDDFGFLGWCYGALSGHVQLYDKVLPEVQRIEAQFPDPDTPIDKVMEDYKAQHALGEKLLASYAKALDAHQAKRRAARLKAVAAGREVWKGSETADDRRLAQLWMSWALPARCTATARKLGAPAVAAP
jgi:hypothetical protein